MLRLKRLTKSKNRFCSILLNKYLKYLFPPDYTPAQKAAAAAHLGAKANEYAVKGYGLYHPYTYGLPYAGYAGYPYTHGLWKRDAEAEAEADPYWTPAVYTASGLVAHANGALVPG